jgi:hypothetical protein
MKDLHEPYAFGIDQLCTISALIHEAEEGDNNGSLDALSDNEINLLIANLSSTVLGTEAERSLGHFTRRKLCKLATWPDWLLAEAAQLDDMDAQGMYHKPCPTPPGAIILRQHWNCSIKPNGRRKARNCCDGSKHAMPQLHAAAQTYASCVEQPCMACVSSLASVLPLACYSFLLTLRMHTPILLHRTLPLSCASTTLSPIGTTTSTALSLTAHMFSLFFMHYKDTPNLVPFGMNYQRSPH